MPHGNHGHSHDLLTPAKTSQDRLAKSAAMLSVGLSIIMIGLKLYGWLISDSLSILSSLTDSLMDVLVSGINLFAIYYALKPADDDHSYGHTAIEDIAGLFQAAMLAGTSLLIGIEAFARFMNPIAAKETNSTAMSIMVICFILTLILVLYQQYVIRRSNSIVIKADSLHYISDLLTTAAVIASLYIWQTYQLDFIDPLLSIIIIAIIGYGAFQIGLTSFHNLMDGEMPDEEREKVTNYLDARKLEKGDILGYHDLRTRRSGRKAFVQLHLELDSKLSLMTAHDIAEDIEMTIGELFTHADVIIHQDPME